VPDGVWTQQERDAVLLDQLERRRHAHDQAQWQAPALTIAGQAFLLQVLADEGLDCVARGFVLAAGLLATIAAFFSLFLLRGREEEYSRRIERVAKRIGIPDPNPPKPRKIKLIWLWAAALAAFFVADIAVYVAAQ
jgi:hypothetical protein